MATARDPWPSRSSILRFNLDAIFLSGSLNSFKDPQLVLKTQVGPPPRVPYTGSRSRVPVTRHVLMVHVKDKANELEMLDLDAFDSSSTSASDIHPCVEYLSSDHSLIFKYAKGAPGNACTLRVKFQEASDLNTVVAELRALRISITISPSSESNGRAIASASVGFLSSQSQLSPHSLLGSSSQEYHSSSPPLIVSQGAQSQQLSYTSAANHQLLPAHLFRPRSGQHSSYASSRSSISPGNQVPRPATTIGIPGTLGEGLYRVSKVVSAPGHRTWRRRSSRLAEEHKPKGPTVSKHFDRTLDRSDIAKLTSHLLPRDEDSPETASQEDSMYQQVVPATQYGEDQNLAKVDHRTGLHGPSVMQPIPEHPQHISRQSLLLPEPRRIGSQNSARSESISHELSRTHSGYPRPYPDIPTSSTPLHGSTHTNGALTTWRPPSIRQEVGTTAPDHHLQLVVQSYHEGLCEATRIWDDLMEKGRKETDMVDDDTDAFKIYAGYAETLATRLDILAGVTVRKMKETRRGAT
ncbi:hypothetical protein QBC39DRAFT_307610 [Podospora conica]|nr:hypothetical protein QBC39DRAFT_307610 [Schizothecium conicum]